MALELALGKTDSRHFRLFLFEDKITVHQFKKPPDYKLGKVVASTDSQYGDIRRFCAGQCSTEPIPSRMLYLRNGIRRRE